PPSSATAFSPLSLPDALPISLGLFGLFWAALAGLKADPTVLPGPIDVARVFWSEAMSGRLPRELVATLLRVTVSFVLAMTVGSLDRKSTRLNSSHVKISYAVF